MSASSPRPRRARLAVALALLVLVLGACTHQRQVPDKYGDTTRDNFTEGCIDAMTADADNTDDDFAEDDFGDTPPVADEKASKACRCAYDGISGPDGIPFERFKEVTEQQEEKPEPLPEDFTEIIDECLDEAGLS